MKIVCVSRGTFGGGAALAQTLAAKLGVPCLAREELTDLATRAGIPVGKLEMAVMRNRPMTELLAAEKERFKAFITSTLCEYAQKGGVVYHGRTGHLVMPSVSHVLRVRVIMDPESRIALTMRRLNLERDKARTYNEQVDDDRRRWARALYNVAWDDPAQYDMVLSLDHMSAENAASAVVAVAQLPDFAPTPASIRTLESLLLASRCRLALGNDGRTRAIDVQLRADAGNITATYHPRHEAAASLLPDVIRTVAGVKDVRCTMASTNILWVQERFDVNSPVTEQLLEIAAKWNAAVGLVRLSSGEAEASEPTADDEPVRGSAGDAGILDDNKKAAPDADDFGMRATMSRLLQEGRAGGQWAVRGGPRTLVQSLDRTAACSLVVVGDVFLDKEASVRKRQGRELAAFITESLRVPTIGSEELAQQYLFKASHWVKMIALAAVAALLFFLVFHFQTEVIAFLIRPGLSHRVVAAGALGLFVPAFAYIYGGFSHYLLRLLKFE